MGQILLIWGFPFYLIALEMLFRGVSGLDVSNFIGPAISTAGLSFLLPLTKPKEYYDLVSEDLLKAVKEKGGEIVNVKDQKLIPFIWIAILCGFLTWFWSSYVSSNSPKEQFHFLPLGVAVGLINYSVAAIFTIAKENV
ncbi:hypothetical protein FLL94_19550 [Vibrio cholerae]|uniref:hypothetical protein n=1 Tax=Vibrio cholerae TaxID=666 RepID=UPI001158615A|nr:hypothetical protein [Vibrio cholerae]TQP18278.1 hypothetical protein FLL94_19550 [Vibrio cholerae]